MLTLNNKRHCAALTYIKLFCFAGQFAENETNEVNFREIPSHVLLKVCMNLTYKVPYANSSIEIPEFPIASKIALELLMGPNFLDRHIK